MDRLRKWEMSVSVDQDLPIILGEYQVNSFKTKCNHCGQDIKHGLLRGVLTKSDSELHLDGDGACFRCKVLTHYDLTLSLDNESGSIVKECFIEGKPHQDKLAP